MLMLQALKSRSIALLWIGQALSSIGDEIYRVTLIWLAVGLMGSNAGYLGAGQCAALLAMSLIAGKWADGWDHFKTMIGSDAIRAVVCIVPVVLFHYGKLNAAALWMVALSVSALGAFFDPALQATLPRCAPNLKELRAATGLMSTTTRIARCAGPALIGLLTPFFALIQFFSLDAASFAISALSVYAIYKTTQPVKRAEHSRLRWRDAILFGFRAFSRTPRLRYHLFAKAVINAGWGLPYYIGLALLVHQIDPTNVRAFGWVITTYGIGNLLAVLVVGNMERRRTDFMIFFGYVWLGAGIFLWSVSTNLNWLMASSFFTAVSGPLNDLPFTDMLQTEFTLAELPKVFRFRIAVDTGANFVCMLISPLLFRFLGVQPVIAVCGLAILMVGVIGWVRHERHVFPETA